MKYDNWYNHHGQFGDLVLSTDSLTFRQYVNVFLMRLNVMMNKNKPSISAFWL